MSAKPKPASKTPPPVWPAFARGLRFEKHDIGAHLDATGHYTPPFQREFPLSVRLFHYRAGRFTQGVTWHEQLELFCPIEGRIAISMGGQTIQLEAGDLLVVDNLKPHHVVDEPGLDARVVVVSFLPELVCSPGALTYDFAFLVPFYAQLEHRPHVLRHDEPAAAEAGEALARLLREMFDPAPDACREAACKVRLLDLLLVLLRRFQDAGVLRREIQKRRQLAQRFSRLFEHIHRPGANKLSLAEAAKLSAMSTAQFTRSFKQVAGMSYVAYIIQTRLAHGVRLLRGGDHTIAEIASITGFADQSHFDRRFKAAFGITPSQFQKRGAAPGQPERSRD